VLARVGEDARSNARDLGPPALSDGQEADVRTLYYPHPCYPGPVIVGGRGATFERAVTLVWRGIDAVQ